MGELDYLLKKHGEQGLANLLKVKPSTIRAWKARGGMPPDKKIVALKLGLLQVEMLEG